MLNDSFKGTQNIFPVEKPRIKTRMSLLREPKRKSPISPIHKKLNDDLPKGFASFAGYTLQSKLNKLSQLI